MKGEDKFAVVTILKYAGDGLWSLEEDVYSGKEAEEVLTRSSRMPPGRPRPARRAHPTSHTLGNHAPVLRRQTPVPATEAGIRTGKS